MVRKSASRVLIMRRKACVGPVCDVLGHASLYGTSDTIVGPSALRTSRNCICTSSDGWLRSVKYAAFGRQRIPPRLLQDNDFSAGIEYSECRPPFLGDRQKLDRSLFQRAFGSPMEFEGAGVNRQRTTGDLQPSDFDVGPALTSLPAKYSG